MKTTKPLATISYNTEPFLALKLDELLKARKIQFYAFIKHQPEEDEKKAHFHVYVEPSSKIDTNDLKDAFIEKDPNGSDKPLKTLNWGKSDFKNWFWYSMHDKRYLASKFESRKYSYHVEDFISSDDDELLCMVRDNPCPLSEMARVSELIEKGLSDEDILLTLNVPVFRITYYVQGFAKLRQALVNKTSRGSRVNHEEQGVQDDDLPF